MKKNKLSFLTIISLGGALFSMHFGASSMIWPMSWGKESGWSVIPAFLGVYLTGVFIPLLGYIALANGEGTFYELSKRISPRFAKLFCNLTIFVLGPLFVIPRMSAAAWDAFLQVTNFNVSNILPVLLFTIMYYLVVYWFISGKDNTIDKISKILLPVLLATVIGVIVKGILNPLSNQGPRIYNKPPFIYGFLEGYSTMELPCALIFGGMMISNLKFKNIKEGRLGKYLIYIGLIGTSILAVSHFSHMYIGSTTYSMFDDLRYSALYAEVVVQLWGNVGGIIFNVGLLFSALTCAVGLTSSTSEFYEETSKGKISYNKAAVIILVLSGTVSILGLGNIVILAEPILTIIYPPAIVMTVYYALIPKLIYNEKLISSMRVAVIIALFFGVIDGALRYLNMFNIGLGYFERIYKTFPLSNYELSWIVFSGIGGIIGYLCSKKAKTPNKHHQ